MENLISCKVDSSVKVKEVACSALLSKGKIHI